MKHTAEVQTTGNTVSLITSMRPLRWKRWAFRILIGFLITMPIAVAMLTGTDKSGRAAVFPVIGVVCLLCLWPGIPLLWNVKGEEWIEVSRSALLVRHNWGFFKTSGTLRKFAVLQLCPRFVRTLAGVDYQTIDFWTVDENGFDKHLFSSVIPVPASGLEAFMAELGKLLEPMGNFDGNMPPVLPN